MTDPKSGSEVWDAPMPIAQLIEARTRAKEIGDIKGLAPLSSVDKALFAGYLQGVRHAQRMIADRIRAELVCCTAEDIERMAAAMGARKRDLDEVGFHHICYWGEMGARLAEDSHSMLPSPYECDGRHPGECWSSRRCHRDGHSFCNVCMSCEECDEERCASCG